MNKNIIISMILGLSMIASAQSALMSDEVEGTNDQSVSNQQQTDQSAQKILAEVRKNLTNMKANFYQYELMEGNQRAEENTGTVWMTKPDKFRWHYKKPYEQLIVADGKKVWVYDEDLEQVTVKPQKNDLNPIYVMLNEELSNRNYHINYEVQDKKKHWISLTPKKKSEEVKKVWLGITDNIVQTIKMVNPYDQTLVFEFSKIKRNDKFSADLFIFKVPEGVDVIQGEPIGGTGEL